MSIRTIKKNKFQDNEVVARVKMFHTNKGWMAATTKTMQLGIAAGAAVAAMGGGASMIASADTVQPESTSGTTTTATSDSVTTAKDVTDKAADSKSTTQDKATQNADSTSEDKTVTDSTSTDKNQNTEENTSSNKNESSDKTNDSTAKDETKPVESTDKNTTTDKTTPEVTKPAVDNQEKPVDKVEVPTTPEVTKPVENTGNTEEVNNETTQETPTDNQNKEEKPVENTENDKADATTPVTPEVSDQNKEINNKPVDKVEDSDVTTTSPEVGKDNLTQDQIKYQESLNDALDAIQNNTFFTEEQKKALSELLKTGKTEHPEDLPQNVTIDNGKIIMFTRGQDDNKVFIAINNAQNMNPDSVDTFATEFNKKGEGASVGPSVHLPQDKNVYTSHMVIYTEDGQHWDAWCLQPMAKGPFEVTGTIGTGQKIGMTLNKLDSQEMMDKYAALIGCAWYGYQGPAAIDKDTDLFNMYTHVAMSIVAWDTNFAGLRDYQTSHNQVTQAMIDKWRAIPEVKAILDKAYTFNADTMKNFNGKNYTFQAYDGHGLDKNGQMIENSQDLFSVQWMSTPVVPKVTTTTDFNETPAPSGDQVQISDKISITDLQKNQEYTVTSQLVDKKTGEVVGTYTETFNTGDSSSKDLIAKVTVSTAQHKDELGWKTTVTPKDSSLAGATHNDKLDDTNEDTPTSQETSVGTTATTGDGQKETGIGQNITIKDNVSYSGLNPGEQYTVKGTLMDKKTGKPVVVNGKEVTATTIFKASESGKGTVTVTFVLPDNIDLQGHDVVAFEELYASKGTLVGEHKDINDKGQTVGNKTVEIHTELTDNTNEQTKGSHDIPVGDGIHLKDEVSYSGLVEGQKYVMTGTLMDKETGKAVQVNGKDVTESVEFVAGKDGKGTVEVHFILPDDIALQGHELVAFEQLGTPGNEKVITKHENWFDKNQTVKIGHPDLHTVATDKNNSHNVVAGEHTTIVDQIQYHDLVPGQKYTVKGTLMDKTTGKAVLDANGKPVTVEKTFIPTTPDGTVSVEFNFDGTKYAGHTLVAFEDIYDEHGNLIEKHEDWNDLAETVYMKAPETPQKGTSTPEKPSTPTKTTPQVGTPAPQVVTPETPQVIDKVVQVGESQPQVGEATSEGVSLPQTGDKNTAAMLAAAGLIAGLGLAGLGKKKRA